ncbi:CS domain [Echinococcus multilocularis]|uniref:CS domain n=1 Tax=Echinococcus multilocularis TaxID=6211 RepID=A0A068YBF9_ECHMU|nr:CS domain [Echinococcus multilocularis]
MASSSSSYTPPYAFISTENDIEYTIQIPDLKIVKKLFGPNLSDNGKIDCEIMETGFKFNFIGSKDLTGKNYTLFVSNFPSKINPCKSSWKPRNGAVDVRLRVSDNPKEVEAKLREERLIEEPEPTE